MCIVTIPPGGRLGNQIYPWLYGLIYSKKWGICLKTLPDPEIKDFINFNFEYCPDCVANNLRGIDSDPDTFLETPPQSNEFNFGLYDLSGDWAGKYQHILQETFKVQDRSDRSEVFIHVRLGDTAWAYGSPSVVWSFARPFEYYQEAMSKLGNPKGFISSDTPDHELVCRLRDSFDLELYDGSPMETITFGAGFNNLILSGGTFSMCMGMISRAENVFRPGPFCSGQDEHVKNGLGELGLKKWTRLSWDFDETGKSFKC